MLTILFNADFNVALIFQLNRMTSWIDGSFVYSTKEAWVNAMRTFENGTFKTVGDTIMGMPPFNTQRIPMFNMPSPNVLKMQSPERMYRKSLSYTLVYSNNIPSSGLEIILFSGENLIHN